MSTTGGKYIYPYEEVISAGILKHQLGFNEQCAF